MNKNLLKQFQLDAGIYDTEELIDFARIYLGYSLSDDFAYNIIFN